MKKFYLLSCFLLFMTISAWSQDQINWMSMNEAMEAQKKEPRKIIMDAYTNWCGPCKLMDKRTFGNKDVVEYINQNYYAVKFNAEGNDTIYYNNYEYTNPKYDPARKNGRNYQHIFARYLKINGYPSVVFFDEEANYIAPVIGYRKPDEIEIFLKMIASDDYKKLTSNEAWEEYQQRFSPQFKN